jgi:flagellin-like protein
MKKMKTKSNPYFTKSVDGKRSFSRGRRKKGVSPVIGVILMVAATIVIAAVVLAMLGGFTAPKRQYLVTATAAENATSYIHVTYTGGPDATLVDSLTCTIDDVDKSGTGEFHNATVGASVGADGTAGANNNHVVVAATFNDGTQQVILDSYV